MLLEIDPQLRAPAVDRSQVDIPRIIHYFVFPRAEPAQFILALPAAGGLPTELDCGGRRCSTIRIRKLDPLPEEAALVAVQEVITAASDTGRESRRLC